MYNAFGNGISAGNGNRSPLWLEGVDRRRVVRLLPKSGPNVGSNALNKWSVSGTCQGCSSETQQPTISVMAVSQVSDSERSHLSVG
jgi:hypothetical protein